MNRRGFLGAIFATGIAPAVARASSLMHVRPIVDATVPIVYGRYDGVVFHEQAFLDTTPSARALIENMKACNMPGPYVALIHPLQAAMLRALHHGD